MAGSAGGRGAAGLPAPLGRSQVVERAGKIALVSVGGVRQGAASRQMPCPAEPRRNR